MLLFKSSCSRSRIIATDATAPVSFVVLKIALGDNSDKDIVAAFMQVDKQKLVKRDGTETVLTTMWFYYEDGTFQQFALSEGGEDILFSEGTYSVSNGSFVDKDSVLTIHRTKKYQDGEGLAPYDSTHDYVIGDLEFLRVYPEG